MTDTSSRASQMAHQPTLDSCGQQIPNAEQLAREDAEWDAVNNKHEDVLHAEWERIVRESSTPAPCPRLEKKGQRGTTGRPMITFAPADVREWNAGRTIRRVA